MLNWMALGVAVTLAQPASPQYGPEVTVYNAGFGVVKEIRDFNLTEGRQRLAVSNVASQIDATSVGFKSLTDPKGVTLLEQNYQYDLISPVAILAKSVGGRVKLSRNIGGVKETLEGTLISAPTTIVANAQGGSDQYYNGLVIQTDDGHIVLDPVGEVEVTSVPKGLISQPTLLWDIDSAKAGSNKIELSYKTGGISWSADFVLTLNDSTRKADLQGWVTMNNESGATYENARLKLLAGEVNVVAGRPPMNGAADFAAAPMAKAAPMQEQQLFEYHLYTLPRPSTINDKEIKQLSLLSGKGISYKKHLIIDSLGDEGQYYPSENVIGGDTQHAKATIEFKNSEDNGLGMPMPAGRVRMYLRDAGGSLQLIGEDQIQHTPKNEKLSLTAGNAFDIVSNRKRLSFKWIGKRQVEETFSISVRNRKMTSENVDLLERHYGDWKVPQTSDAFTKADANTMLYTIHLKPNEVKVVKYTVQTKW